MSELKTNLNEVSKKFDRLIKHLTKDGIRQAIDASLQLVGFAAVADHMIQTTRAQAITFPVDDEKLTMRIGTLAGSLVNARCFSRAELPTEISSYYLKEKPKTLRKLPGIDEGIHRVTVTGTNIEGEKGTTVEYASKHEYGQDVQARPFLTPALMESQDKISTIFQMTVKSEGRLLGFL